jgi:NTE family protein
MTYALVLGGGGVTGIAWETGLLRGLSEAGIDLTGADLVVGTSAGAVVGAQIATGVSLEELYHRQVRTGDGAAERPPDLGPLFRAMGARPGDDGWLMAQSRPSQQVLAWIGKQARAASTKANEASRIQVIKNRLPVHEWPDRPLLVTAIDTGDGSLVVWTKDSDVPLPLAVASSCAVPWVFPPVGIKGRRYMDGGVRSATNADLAAGHELVVILAPMAGMGSAVLLQEVAELRAAGASVEVLVPDQAVLEAMGPNPLDPAYRRPTAEAGLAQAAAAAEALAEVRSRLAV